MLPKNATEHQRHMYQIFWVGTCWLIMETIFILGAGAVGVAMKLGYVASATDGLGLTFCQ